MQHAVELGGDVYRWVRVIHLWDEYSQFWVKINADGKLEIQAVSCPKAAWCFACQMINNTGLSFCLLSWTENASKRRPFCGFSHFTERMNMGNCKSQIPAKRYVYICGCHVITGQLKKPKLILKDIVVKYDALLKGQCQKYIT